MVAVAETAERCKGLVAKWLNHKGIGFITPEGAAEEEQDILVHYSQVQQESKDGFKSLATNSEVEYDLQTDPKDESKKVAVNVTGPGGVDCEARGKGERKGKGKGGKGGKKGKGKGKGKKSGDEAEDDE